MTEDDLNRRQDCLDRGRRMLLQPFFRFNNLFDPTDLQDANDAGHALLEEVRRLRALVESVKALAWGGHPEAGDDPAAIREYLRDLLVSEPDGATGRDDEVPEERLLHAIRPRRGVNPPSCVYDAYPFGTWRALIRSVAHYRERGGFWKVVCGTCTTEPGTIVNLDVLEIRQDGGLILAGQCDRCRCVFWTDQVQATDPISPAEATPCPA